jgi:hypothetical protein
VSRTPSPSCSNPVHSAPRSDALGADGVHEQRLQILAADADVGEAVLARDLAHGPAREQPAGRGAVLGHRDRRADLLHLVVEAEPLQRAGRVGPHVKAAAELDLADVAGALEDERRRCPG